MWQHFSEWLLLAGLVFGALAALAGAVDFLVRPEVRAPGAAWPHALGSVIALVLAIVNSFVHAADGWTGVVPYGLILSAATVVAGHADMRLRIERIARRGERFEHPARILNAPQRRSEEGRVGKEGVRA